MRLLSSLLISCMSVIFVFSLRLSTISNSSPCKRSSTLTSLYSARHPTGTLNNELQINCLATKCSVADEVDGRWEGFERDFLLKYWQKRPVLIRNFIPDILREVDIGPEMLIELAMDEDVESRVVVRTNSNKWKKKSGPFTTTDFQHLQADRWTLLVQEVDRHVPAVADLWSRHFNFLPTWRRDDVMVSYARKDGGIGAHVDNYDVFLVQGRGSRRWSIENSFVGGNEELAREVPNVQTRLLTGFRADQGWDMRPGDCLYLPPRVPHMGVSLDDDCVTISMGFRAPSFVSMCAAYVEYVSSAFIDRTDMFADPLLTLQPSIGVVTADAIQSIQVGIQDKLVRGFEDSSSFNNWLGKYLTIPLRSKPSPTAFYLSSCIIDGIEADEFEEEDEEEFGVPLYVRGRHRVAMTRMWPTSQDLVRSLEEGEVHLRRAEGLKVALLDETLFIDGRAKVLPKAIAGDLGHLLTHSNVVDSVGLALLFKSMDKEAVKRHGTFPHAHEAANQDEDLSVVSHTNAWKEDPTLKSTVSFRVTFGDGTIVWLPTTSIEQTIPDQTFPCLCRLDPLEMYHAHHISESDLRFYGFQWYDEDLTLLPDRFDKKYVVEYEVLTVNKKFIKVYCHAFNET